MPTHPFCRLPLAPLEAPVEKSEHMMPKLMVPGSSPKVRMRHLTSAVRKTMAQKLTEAAPRVVRIKVLFSLPPPHAPFGPQVV